ncbi:hypothetical protein B711_0499 [Chlamydia psittaci CP3]|nr:hypothetical protein B711_0499 [Chlamydia psittaci CP3]
MPGRASKINLARTSATLSDPLAMTRKFTKKTDSRQQFLLLNSLGKKIPQRKNHR